MKTIITVLALFTLGFGVPVMAGSGHDHGHSHAHEPVNEATAQRNATKVISSLVQREKIDKSWATVKARSVEKKMVNGQPEWLTIFFNEKITKVEEQTLYVFLTIGGEYIAVNYSGK